MKERGHTAGVLRNIFYKNAYKGQVTIFIIVGILLVVGIAMFFVFQKGLIPGIGGGKEINPNSFLDSCLEESVLEISRDLAKHGGTINNPLNKYFKFTDEAEAIEISYLCYNQVGPAQCVNQNPMLINHLENEIKNNITQDVEFCFNKLKESLKKDNYDVKEKYGEFDVELNLGKIIISIDRELTLTKLDETKIQKNFGVIVSSKLYDLALVAKRIVNSETQFCDFGSSSYMLIYPKIDIDLFTDGQGEKIYTVKNRDTQEWFRFAVRGCIL